MNLVRYPATPCLSVEPESGGGLLLRRHKTLLTRRSVVYFCSGAHTFTLLRSDTLQEVNWTTTSGASSLVIDMPAVHLKSAKLGASGNMVVWQIEGDETTILNVGGAGVMNASVINSQATAYLVGA